MAKVNTGKWIVNYDNGLPFGTIDITCPECLGGVICPKVDIPRWCGRCGADNMEGCDDDEIN